MIRVEINGEVKYFAPGMIVQDVIDEFDNLDANETIAVRVNGVRLSMEDIITEDCEIELLSFRDLGSGRFAFDYRGEEDDDDDDGEDVFSPDYLDPFAMMGFNPMLGEYYLEESDEEYSDEVDSDQAESDGSQQDELPKDSLDDSVPDESNTGANETENDEYGAEFEPESDGEFISVNPHGSGELTEEMLGSESQVSSDADVITVSETEDMQMHLGVPKIDDLVAELLVDIESKTADDTELSHEEDYSVDDADMDAFLASKIIPEATAVAIEPLDESEENMLQTDMTADTVLTEDPVYEVDEASMD